MPTSITVLMTHDISCTIITSILILQHNLLD